MTRALYYYFSFALVIAYSYFCVWQIVVRKLSCLVTILIFLYIDDMRHHMPCFFCENFGVNMELVKCVEKIAQRKTSCLHNLFLLGCLPRYWYWYPIYSLCIISIIRNEYVIYSFIWILHSSGNTVYVQIAHFCRKIGQNWPRPHRKRRRITILLLVPVKKSWAPTTKIGHQQ